MPSASHFRPVGYSIALVTGIPPSMVVGAAVFADGPPILAAERLAPVIISYVLVAGIFSFVCSLIWSPGMWWRWGVLISMPAFAIIGLMGSDIGRASQLLYAVVTVTSTYFGAYLGILPTTLLFKRRREV